MRPFEHPIGTQIRYVTCYEDCEGKIGKIVGVVRDAPLVYLPESTCVSRYSTIEKPATVQCCWWDIERVATKNKQLLFSFMD